MSEERAKSRLCETCKRRHDVNHAHFKEAGRDRKADTVTGSKSAADLAGKAASGFPSNAQSRAALEKQKKEQEQEIREAQERRWARRCRTVYAGAAFIFGDPKIRLTDEEEKDFGQVHADFAIAWGITASTKIEATADLLIVHLVAFSARTPWAKEMADKFIEWRDGRAKTIEAERAAEPDHRDLRNQGVR